MLVASISAAVLFLVGGVFGYALYVLAFGPLYGGLGLVAGSVGWSMLVVLGGASLALGSGVYYIPLCAVRLFALIAREAVAAAPVPGEPP